MVRDPSGAAIPETQVVVTNLATNVPFAFQTDATGNYFVPSLIPGQYRVDAEKAGFKKVTVTPVAVEVNQTVRLDFSLTIGQLAEAVEVVGTPPALQTDTVTLGQVIGNRQVTELPLNGRDFTNLIRLSAGVTEMQGTIGTNGGYRRHGMNDNYKVVSVNGSRPSSMSILIDGVNSVEPEFQQPTLVPPPDVIQEFQLQNGLYSAQFGMGSGQVNIALKSGTNELHGALWEFLRNDALQPKNPRSQSKTPLKQNQFGFTAGGPLLLPEVYDGRDRTFLFGSFQESRRRTGSYGEVQVPTAAERQGDFSGWNRVIYDPATGVANPGGAPAVIRQPFAGNRIPSSRFASVSRNLVTYLANPNVDCAMPCNNLRGTLTTPTDARQFTLRVDHNLAEADRIFAQYLWQNDDNYAPSFNPASGATQHQRSQLATLQWAHIISPRTINEARFGYNRFYFLAGWETAFGPVHLGLAAGLKNVINQGAYYALPTVGLGSGYLSIGSQSGGSYPIWNVSNIFHYVDNLTLTRGNHSIKLGADIRRGQNMNQNGLGGQGSLTFTGAYTARDPLGSQGATTPTAGIGFADFLLGDVASEGHAAFDQSQTRLRNWDINLFFQDDFRITPQLTLNLGLRWELHTPYLDKWSGGMVFDYGYPGGRNLYRDSEFVRIVNDPIYATLSPNPNLVPTDYTDFAPRVGFAWRPFASNNRFVIRSGFGIAYDISQSWYQTLDSGVNRTMAAAVTPTPTYLETISPIHIDGLFPAPYSIAGATRPAPYCQNNQSRVVVGGAVTQINDYCYGGGGQYMGNRTPYTMQWGFNLQYEPVPNLALELGYAGSHSVNLPIRLVINQAALPLDKGNANNSLRFRALCPAGSYPDKCSPIQDRVPYASFSSATNVYANMAYSTYHALTFRADKRFAHGLQGLLAFTWGKAIDQYSEQSNGHGGNWSWYAQDSHNLSAERGVAAFDQPRRLVMSFVYELPFGKGKPLADVGGLLNHILGGWQSNGILTFSDGSPFTVNCITCLDRAQTGNSNWAMGGRADLVKNPLPSGFQRTRTQWFDTTAFAVPELGTYGTSGRNILRGPGQRATDFSMVKNNKIGEKRNLQFRAEFFNLFSGHFYNVVYPTFYYNYANFGSLYPVGGDAGNLFNPRVIQFALKLAF